MKLITEVSAGRLPVGISLRDRICVLGSCFADNMGVRLKECGFDVLVNPFGTLYNPASVASAIARLDSGDPFREDDCVEMGAGAGLVCSYSHHTSFARPSSGEFLALANDSLEQASRFWKECGKVIVTLGTAFVWEDAVTGRAVSNCLKRPAREFRRRMLEADEVRDIVSSVCSAHPDKEFIFTVSPIRHLGDGARSNTLSKSALHLGLRVSEKNFCYFDSYEIVMDELRDYRFYADDLVHPSDTAVEYVWDKFVSAAVDPADLPAMDAARKAVRQSKHRKIH